jgi:hypothetical protein
LTPRFFGTLASDNGVVDVDELLISDATSSERIDANSDKQLSYSGLSEFIRHFAS